MSGALAQNSRALKARSGVAASALAALSGCYGPLSTLAPAGRDAQEIANLFWWMAGAGVLIWLLVMGLAFYAIFSREHERKKTKLLIIGGGTVLPTLCLTVLLGFGLAAVPRLLARGDPSGPKIRVIGEQWWWRVRYELSDGTQFELANELRLPLGQRVTLELATADVIHSFWIPSLAGKVDMIPGRTNVLSLEPTRTGSFLGNCAEYCGVSHARMMLQAVVLEPAGFDAWANRQAQDASENAQQSPGAQLFLRQGCGACHTVRGTGADGSVGPDLTHVGSRRAIGAGVLPNTSAGFARWLVSLDELKPQAHMPTFEMLPRHDLEQLSEYLERLE